MDKEQLQGQIRFALEQLSAKNEQMRFERLCMHLARLRIAVNVIPATGPVQAGGDQGRDFETFHSYLKDSPLAEHLLIGRISDGCLAFACSTEKNPGKGGKILRDAKSILASGAAVKRVYFFSSQDIPVGERHKVQEKVRTKLKIEVEIWDGRAISLHLTDPDAFWIATRFLDIPSDAFPSQDLTAPWYSDLKEKYTKAEVSFTYEEFADLKLASRFIYKDQQRKVDLPLWVNRLIKFAEKEDIPMELRRNAIYEMFVVRMVGMHDVTGTEAHLRYYFSDFERLNVAEYKDACALLSFSLTSSQLFDLQIERTELLARANEFEALLNTTLEEASDSSVKCSILEALANYELTMPRNNEEFTMRIKAYVDVLERMVPLLPQAVFFPIGHLASDITKGMDMFLDLGIEVDGLDQVAEKIDTVLAQQSGRIAKAGALRERALVHYKHGRYLHALEMLQRISRDWFNEDSMKGYILCLLLIADCYARLKLHHASKGYALSAAYLILKRNLRDYMTYLARALATAARADYSTGSWMHYFELATVTLVTHHVVIKDFNPYEEEREVIYYPMLILYFSRRYNLGISDLLEEQMARWGYVKEDVLEFSTSLRVKLDDISDDDLKGMLGQYDGEPFNDIGAQRQLSFAASGLTFRVRCTNSYDHSCLLEHVTSALQILLADLAAFDMLFVPSQVDLYVEYRTGETSSIHGPTAAAPRAWRLTSGFHETPTRDSVGEATMQFVASLGALLRSYSLLPDADFKSILEKVIGKGDIVSKIFLGVHYHDLYRFFYSSETNESQTRSALQNTLPKREEVVVVNAALPWRSDIASQYSETESLKNIQGRLGMKNTTRLTLPILLASPVFLEGVNALRSEGWLDWHIYLALLNTVMNYKLNHRGLNRDPKRMMEDAKANWMKDEAEWYVEIPLSAVNKERLRQFLEIQMPIILLTNYGLENHAQYVDPQGTLELLRRRFRLFDDGKELTFVAGS